MFPESVVVIITYFTVTLQLAQLKGLNLFDPELNISATFRWIPMKLCEDIHGPQRMNPSDSGDSMSFSLAPPTDLIFHLSSEISPRVTTGLTQKLVKTFMVPKG